MPQKRCLGLLLPLLLLATEAGAVERTYTLEANLSNPPDTAPYVNIETCDDAQNFDFYFSWSVPAGVNAGWDETQHADVFLSTSETCSSVSVEIGDPATEEGVGEDVEIEVGQTTGNYPLANDPPLTLADITNLDCSTESQEDYYFCIKWKYTFTDYSYYTPQDVTITYYGAAPFRFDTQPPGVPALTAIDVGDNNLKVHWDPPTDDDLAGFYVKWREQGAADWQDFDTVPGGSSDYYQIKGLTNYVTYEVEVSAYDEANNEGDPSDIMEGEPVRIEDFYEYYKDNGGTGQGGFCFVATAAYGSYDDSMVRELRGLRDEVLAPTAAGRELIASYYRFGPRWARAIRHHDVARGAARVALTPLVGLATLRDAGPGEWLVLLAALGLLGWLVVRFRRWLARAVRRSGPAAVVLAVGLGLLAWGAPARAQMVDEPAIGRVVEPVPDFQLQLRFGPYYPDVDSGPGLDGARPFHDIFGSGSEMLFEIGLDYEIWRGFGAVTVGGSAGFVQYLGKGRTEEGDPASDTAVFNLLPLRLTVGYHFTQLDDYWNIPLVPYVLGGLSYYVWWATDGVGDIAKYENPDTGQKSDAVGGIFGLHVGGGLKLLLDWLDGEAALALQNDVGVINTYLFAEYTYSWVNGFGSDKRLDVSDGTFMFGLMIEF